MADCSGPSRLERLEGRAKVAGDGTELSGHSNGHSNGLDPIADSPVSQRAKPMSRKSETNQSVRLFVPQPKSLKDAASRFVRNQRYKWQPEGASEGAEMERRRTRLLQRDAPFHQSSGKLHMRRSGLGIKGLRRLAAGDWFHVAAAMRSQYLILGFACFYTSGAHGGSPGGTGTGLRRLLARATYM